MWSLHLWYCFWPWLRSQRRLPGDFQGFGIVMNLQVGRIFHSVLHDFGCSHFISSYQHVYLAAQLWKDRLPLRRLYLLHLQWLLPVFWKRSHHKRHRPKHLCSWVSVLMVKAEPFGACTGQWLPHWHVFRGRFQTRSCVQDPWNQLCLSFRTVYRCQNAWLVFEILHHFRALHSIRVTGIIFNFGGNGQLTAGVFACVHYRIEICSGCIDGCCIT